jgi:Flp pilus assembly protein TadD
VKEPDPGLRELVRRRQDDHSGESRLALAKRLAAARDFNAAILCLQEGLHLAPEDPELWSQLARLLLAVGR